MKFSQRTLLKLKNKNKKLKPNKYKKLKRESLRGRIKGTVERPRLSVYRSNENIYAQIIDDTSSKTLVACSTLDRSIKLAVSTGRTKVRRNLVELFLAVTLMPLNQRKFSHP